MCISSPTIPELWCDNLSAMALASNPVFQSCSKHIEIDCHFIREKVLAKKIALKYVSTFDQIADIFTKPLSHSQFHYLKDKLLVLPCPFSLWGNDKLSPSDQPPDQTSNTEVESQSQHHHQAHQFHTPDLSIIPCISQACLARESCYNRIGCRVY